MPVQSSARPPSCFMVQIGGITMNQLSRATYGDFLLPMHRGYAVARRGSSLGRTRLLTPRPKML